jgi:salicylate hydroxylase
MRMWVGEGKHFLVFPVRAGQLLNYVGFVGSDTSVRESWSAPGDPVALAAEFAGWDPMIGKVIAAVRTPSGSGFQWGMYDRAPLPRWSTGRLTLLGDAAHPMLPHLGQGLTRPSRTLWRWLRSWGPAPVRLGCRGRWPRTKG